MPLRVLQKNSPRRVVALASDSHVLSFSHSPAHHTPVSSATHSPSQHPQASCLVEFQDRKSVDLRCYRSLNSLSVQGTLGVVTIDNDVFLCLVTGASKVATVRPGEDVRRITSVEFYCITRPDHDDLLDSYDRYTSDSYDDSVLGTRPGQNAIEHPCASLKKLLSGSSFYYSADFDLTRRLQDRINLSTTVALDSLDGGYLWNAFMIQPLVNFRSRLAPDDRKALDDSRILTSAIRGFAMTIPVPASSSPINAGSSGMPSTITLISRLSCRRAGTRFKSRGVDDDGNVANYVETETVFCAPTGLCFSYVQMRGSVPVFWEQAAGFTPAQQKISLSRSAEATQPAFDKHIAEMQSVYGGIHIVNLLSNEKPGEVELTDRYRYHVSRSPLNNRSSATIKSKNAEHDLLQETDYDFHAETRGHGYEAASGIKRYIQDASESFVYFLSEEVKDEPRNGGGKAKTAIWRPMTILQQGGVFRTNCLDCLDRTNLVQTIISQMAIEELLRQRGERASTADFLLRHSTLWADNGDALSKIYAGTGALKSSFTRSGKMSFAGALADVRKSATRLYINNFEDKGRQQTIDLLLGRLMGQTPVHLFDPIHDHVTSELQKRSAEYTSTMDIGILVATFNLNGRDHGLDHDLSPWLCPPIGSAPRQPEIVAVGFQEVVDLSPQQIMSTDPNRRLAWEDALKKTLNANAQKAGAEEYILLRGGQLVGASLSVYVKASVLPHIKNVEGSLIKTGLSGMAGNKGAVAIRMDYAQTSLCLVTAHLAAGFANYEERNQDYATISRGLHFQRSRHIEDHDAIIWFGDFNYRIGMSNDRVRQLIKSGDLETLYANDQLNLQMVHGRTFPHYNEAKITFLPTYKYNVGTDEYDSSPSQRIPAWCDRVLAKGNCLRQTHYDTASSLKFSDHRPVFATYRCAVSVVDDRVKARISEAVYARRRGVVERASEVELLGPDSEYAHASDSSGLVDVEKEYVDVVDSRLPPASSDKQKWWLDGGLPARSQLVGAKIKSDASNPFTAPAQTQDQAQTQDEWVQVDRPIQTPPKLPARVPMKKTLRPPPVPTKPAILRHDQSQSRGQRDESSHRLRKTSRPNLPDRPGSSITGRQPTDGSSKPVLVRTTSAQSSRPGSSASASASRTVSGATNGTTHVSTTSAPQPPAPRRSTIVKSEPARHRSKSRGSGRGRGAVGGKGGVGNLMDDNKAGGSANDLSSWEPLRPS